MDISEIKKRVREIVEEEFEVSLLGHLDEQILFDGELMRDSIGTINLIVRIEDMFSIEFKDEDLIEDFFESIDSISLKIAEYLNNVQL
ncbi:MAG: phosphopantetheine-binding protein [Oscillospiraceae bacterium]|nr:phosphopantetheine-binding protein [Oscillospiraceae bacterium]MDD7041158.1 phosphopantetheine-binding protein [Oscillospiraceae bacterium]MDY2611144.1 phosphopantetheine-binding protein [Oscillospiraceae bacterium]